MFSQSADPPLLARKSRGPNKQVRATCYLLAYIKKQWAEA